MLPSPVYDVPHCPWNIPYASQLDYNIPKAQSCLIYSVYLPEHTGGGSYEEWKDH